MYRDKVRISQAENLPQEFQKALDRWRAEADSILHSGRIGWYAKLTSTTFEYNGVAYIVIPEDVYAPDVFSYYYEKCSLNVLEAGFELLQGTITRDLKELGATKILNWGMID